MNQAFILGAGLGTRLRPLTDRLPKPLVPLFHRPLALWAMDACMRSGIRRFAINTHHLPEAWDNLGMSETETDTLMIGGNGLSSSSRLWRGHEITLFHEPLLLETGGGLKNIAAWMANAPLLVHNGDIFSSLPLEKLIAAHETSGLPVTLALRSVGDARHIAIDPSMTRVTDIRGRLGLSDGTHVFSGIYCVNPEFLGLLPEHEKVAVIPAFLELAKQGRLGAIVLDDGVWLDLGNRESYLEAHRVLDLGPRIHPLAVVEPGAVIRKSIVGPGAVIESGAVISNSVVWPEARVAGDARLDQCIVCSGMTASGTHRRVDF